MILNIKYKLDYKDYMLEVCFVKRKLKSLSVNLWVDISLLWNNKLFVMSCFRDDFFCYNFVKILRYVEIVLVFLF